MDSLLIMPLVTWFMQHPEYVGLGLILLMFMQVGLVYFWISPLIKKVDIAMNSLNTHAEEAKAHILDSQNRGQQTETIKDHIIEIKGIMAGMNVNNRDLK